MPKVEGGTRARFYRWHCNERFAQGFTVAQLAQTGHPRLAAAQHQTGPPELDSQVASSVSVAPRKGLQQSVMKEPAMEGGTRTRFYRCYCNERVKGFTVAQLAQTGHPIAAAQHQTGPPALAPSSLQARISSTKGLQQSSREELCDGLCTLLLCRRHLFQSLKQQGRLFIAAH